MLVANVTQTGSVLGAAAAVAEPLSEPVVKRPSALSPAQPASMTPTSNTADEARIWNVICKNPQTIGFAVNTRGAHLFMILTSLRRLCQQRQGIVGAAAVAK
jgi:hypothetical protein